MNTSTHSEDDVFTDRSFIEMYKSIMENERKNTEKLVDYLKDQIEYLKNELTRKSDIIEKLIDNNNKSLECFSLKPNSNPDQLKLHTECGNNSSQLPLPIFTSLDQRNVTERNKNKRYTEHSNVNEHHIANDYDATSNSQDCTVKTLPNVAILGDSILNNIESRGISKSGNVQVSSFPGATSDDLRHHVKPTINREVDVIILHIGSNDLTKGGDTITNIQHVIDNVKKKSSFTKIAISSLLIRKDKHNMENLVNELNIKLKSLSEENLIDYIDNSNIDDSCLGVKKVHPNKKGKAYLANNFKRYISTL